MGEDGRYWGRLMRHWVCDVKVWCVIMGMFLGVRLLFLGVYEHYMEEGSGVWEVVQVLMHGFRFDGRFALMGILPTVGLSLLCYWGWMDRLVHGLRRWILGIIVCGLMFLAVADLAFFGEYHEQFNQWVFGLLYDDFGALVQTVWSSYPIVWGGLLFGLVCYLLIWGFVKWLGVTRYRGVGFKGFVLFFLVFLMGAKVVATGTWDMRVLSRKDTAIVADSFLNGLVYSPVYALYSAVRDKNKRMRQEGKGAYVTREGVSEALECLYPGCGGQVESIDELMKRSARGEGLSEKPRHIFLVVMESQDGWAMKEEYEGLELANNLKRYASEGVALEYGLPAGEGTMPALSALVLGLPGVGVETQYQAATREPMLTAVAQAFKGLGYRAQLFYGGNMNWRRLGEFARNQGFDRVYGQESIAADKKNEWGVDDKYLFEFVREVCVGSDEPTFNLIMTTSNHPPHTIDVYGEGYGVSEVPESLRGKYDGGVDLRTLGHMWYADRCLGEFVDGVVESEGSSLFVMTGDHWSRRFLNAHPSVEERACVPIVFYRKGGLEGYKGEGVVGTHIDIGPTVVEMVAPKGYEYWSQGRDVFDGGREQISSSMGYVVTQGGVVERKGEGREQDFAKAQDAVAWWRLMQGNREQEKRL